MQTENDGRNDFDFLTGTWKVHHKLLKGRLSGSTEWDEFEGTCVDKKILNGLGNFDEVNMYTATGTFNAVALRLFDINSKEWSISGQERDVGRPHGGRLQRRTRRVLFPGSLRRAAYLQPLHLV
jgi:hypothetical protein